MTSAFLPQKSFSAGEISPEMFGLTDNDFYKLGLRRLRNGVVSKYGTAKKRPGSRFLAETQGGVPARMVPFRIPGVGNFQVEFTEFALHVYDVATETLVDLDGMGLLKLTTPYTEAQILEFQFAQSEKILYLVHGDVPEQALIRSAVDGTWTFVELDTKGTGPFVNRQSREFAVSVQISPANPQPTPVPGATVMLVSEEPLFEETDAKGSNAIGHAMYRVNNRWYRCYQFISRTQMICIAEAGHSDSGIAPRFGDSNNVTLYPNSFNWDGPWVATDFAGPIMTDDISGFDAEPWEGITLTSATPFFDDTKIGIIVSVAPDETAFMAPPDLSLVQITKILTTTTAEGVIMGTSSEDFYRQGQDGGAGNTRSIIRTLEQRVDTDFILFAADGDTSTVRLTASQDFFNTNMVGSQVSFEDGSLEITGVPTPTRADCTVIRDFTRYVPQSTEVNGAGFATAHSSYASTKFARGLDDESGFPQAIGFHQNRHCIGGIREEPQKVICSKPGNHDDFNLGTARAGDAISIDITSDRANRITWLRSANDLLVGTDDGEYAVGGLPLTPTSLAVRPQTTYGGLAVGPAVYAGFVVFPIRDQQTIRALKFSFDSEQYEATEVTRPNNFIFRGLEVQQLQIAREPDALLYVQQNALNLKVMSYRPREGVEAWSPWSLPTISVSSVPNVTQDAVWCCAQRVIDGITKNYVEIVEGTNELMDSYLEIATPGSTTITGLDHLEAEFVAVIADGEYLGEHLVIGGAIDLSEDLEAPPTGVIVGLNFLFEMVFHVQDFTDDKGSTVGRIKSIDKAIFRIFETAGVTVDGFPLGEDVVAGVTPVLFSGEIKARGQQAIDGQATVQLLQAVPFKVEVQAILIWANVDE